MLRLTLTASGVHKTTPAKTPDIALGGGEFNHTAIEEP
jgi:hypothetical protein